jgi:hypothetical protein
MAARGVVAALAAGAILAQAGAAAAATPRQISQRIFADLADNGRLDAHYTRKQINRALHAPSLQGYEQQPVSKPAAVVPAAVPPADPPGSIPFSGLDLALFGGVGGPLLLLGASLGRLARVKPEAIDG